MGLSILVCDEHPIFRTGVKTTLNDVFPGCDIREAANINELESALAKAVPNLLLIDVFFPGMEIEDGIRDLRRNNPFMGILIISMLTQEGEVDRLMRAGGDGFVSKTAPDGSLKLALKELMNGENPVFLPNEDGEAKSMPKGNLVDTLPPRQSQVFHYICLGMSNKEIAAELDLSVSTVRAHISALFAKLGVSNRTEMASYGVRFGILAYSGSHKKYCKFIGPQKSEPSNENTTSSELETATS